MSQGSGFDRRGLRPDEVSPIPGMSQVLSALDLLARQPSGSVVVSVASSDRDSELIALSQEAAEQSGMTMDIESQHGVLALRFTNDRGRTKR